MCLTHQGPYSQKPRKGLRVRKPHAPAKLIFTKDTQLLRHANCVLESTHLQRFLREVPDQPQSTTRTRKPQSQPLLHVCFTISVRLRLKLSYISIINLRRRLDTLCQRLQLSDNIIRMSVTELYEP